MIVQYDLDQVNKDINSTQKEIGKILKVRLNNKNMNANYRRKATHQN